MLLRYLPLDSRLKRQLQGADLVLRRPDRSLDYSIALRFSDWRMLVDRLVISCFNDPVHEVGERWLLIRLNHDPFVAEASNVLEDTVDGAINPAPL